MCLERRFAIFVVAASIFAVSLLSSNCYNRTMQPAPPTGPGPAAARDRPSSAPPGGHAPLVHQASLPTVELRRKSIAPLLPPLHRQETFPPAGLLTLRARIRDPFTMRVVARDRRPPLYRQMSYHRLPMLDYDQPPKLLSTWQLFRICVVLTSIEFGWCARACRLSYLKLVVNCRAMGEALVLPFLISVGVPESVASTIFVVNPVIGVFVHAHFGTWTDQCTSSWGRRRPFILLCSCCA